MKSVLQSILEKDVPLMPSVSQGTCCIIDCMALLQSLTQVPKAFALLADKILKMPMSCCKDAFKIDVVGDLYPEVSIKDPEHT